MKTYEEMARDVLKRRDEELQKTEQSGQASQDGEIFYPTESKKRGLLPAIAISGAAVAVIAVTVGIRVSRLRGDGGNAPGPGTVSEEQSESASSSDVISDIIISDSTGESNEVSNIMPKGTYVNGVFVLDSAPEYLIKLKHRFFNGRGILEPVIHVPFDINDLNSYYGIEFDRMGRLHPDWEPVVSREWGVYVYDGEDATDEFTDDGMTVGGREVISSLNEISYNFREEPFPAGDLILNFERIGIGEDMFSPFDSAYYKDMISPEAFSVINGRKALVYWSSVQALAAIIEIDGTLVRISGFEAGYEDFLRYLDEFTKPDDEPVEITPWEDVPQDKFSNYILNYTPPENEPMA